MLLISYFIWGEMGFVFKYTYLLSLNLLGIEIVSFCDIKMGDNVLIWHRLEHTSFYIDVVVELFILALFEVVHNRDLRRVVF